MALDAALAAERRGDERDAEMRLAFRARPGMALVQMRFIVDAEALGLKRPLQFLFDARFDQHDAAILFA